MRDNSLARHLITQGHEVSVLPTYLPHLLDEPSVEKKNPIFFGGVNVYLQHKFSFFRKTPRWLDQLLNSKRLLRWVARRSGMTTPRDLGEITLSTLRGKEGPLDKEVNKVIDWFKKHGKPDILVLSTVLLASVGRAAREDLGIPVVTFLQGEDGFLDSLLPKYRKEAWALLGKDAKTLDGCISPSQFFACEMSKRLDVPPVEISYLPNGISLEGYTGQRKDLDQPTLGYFARICPEKGLDLLIDAFVTLKRSGHHPNLKLAIAGTLPRENKSFLNDQIRKISAAGLEDTFNLQTDLSREEKIDFLGKLTLFSVPARIPEAFGIYVIEALAAGVPVVLPDHGSFPELIEKTEGGILYNSSRREGLAETLSVTLSDSKYIQALGQKGREAIIENYSNEKLANQLVENILAPLATSQ
jgi:glycosyltransferase involved in cell wall biosynthesis